jgi:hypothetical protein
MTAMNACLLSKAAIAARKRINRQDKPAAASMIAKVFFLM